MTEKISLSLISKPGCHLCDDARSAIERVLFGFRASHPSLRVDLEELNILDDEELANRYREEIPVLMIDGQVHNYFRIDEARLRAALDERAGK